MHEMNDIEFSEWNRLGNTYYERRTLYNFGDEESGSGTPRFAAARNGGPVAHYFPDASSNNTPQVVQLNVFSSSGRKLSRIAYEVGSTLLQFGWTRKEVCLFIYFL